MRESLAQHITRPINPLSYIHTDIHSISIPDEFITVIYTLNNSTPGNDKMSATAWKQYIEIYIEPLTYLTNLSLN